MVLASAMLCLSSAAALAGAYWSAESTRVLRESAATHEAVILGMAVSSPDRRYVLRIEGNELVVETSGQKLLATRVPVGATAEVQWAPDSSAFAVTDSDGGAVGTWSAVLYLLTDKGLRRRDFSPAVRASFRRRPKGCDETPNVALVGWTGAATVLFVAQAPNHSSCSDMGALRGYEVTLADGGIKRELSATQLRSEFPKLLGSSLLRD
jgi:hypothetical protein